MRHPVSSHLVSRGSLVLLAGSAALFGGCGGGERFDTAEVRGKVLCAGTPVSGGRVTFSPIPAAGEANVGRPATGEVGPDGTFVLSTYDDEDGAVVGKHLVRYEPASQGDEGEEGAAPAAPVVPNACGNSEPVELTVAEGENDLTVELTPTRGKPRND